MALCICDSYHELKRIDVASGFAGIVSGKDAIPAGWMKALRGKDVIESCLF